MFESHQPEPRQTESKSQTVGRPENEAMHGADRQPVIDDAHREAPGEPVQPEAGHPVPGAGSGMPEQGAGRAKEQSTPETSTEDQGRGPDWADAL